MSMFCVSLHLSKVLAAVSQGCRLIVCIEHVIIEWSDWEGRLVSWQRGLHQYWGMSLLDVLRQNWRQIRLRLIFLGLLGAFAS